MQRFKIHNVAIPASFLFNLDDFCHVCNLTPKSSSAAAHLIQKGSALSCMYKSLISTCLKVHNHSPRKIDRFVYIHRENFNLNFY